MNLSLLTSGILSITNIHSGTLLSNFENVLGTSLELKIKASNQKLAENAESQVLDFIRSLQNKLGANSAGQGLFEFNQTFQQPVEVSAELKEVMQLFVDWNKNTSNAIHPNANLLTNLWKDAEAKNLIPSDEDLHQTVEKLKSMPFEFHENGLVSKLSQNDIRLHSLAKGYVLEKASEFALQQPGVTGVVINLGGDLTAKGEITELVRISDPFSSEENANSLGLIAIKDESVASSGNYKNYFEIQNERYSHILDPNSGRPAQEIVHSTVRHPNAVTAGALATAFNILPTHQSGELAERFDQSAYLLIDQSNKQFSSENWTTLPETSANTVSFVHLKEKSWNPNLQLQINLELADLGGYARRPYVAVWVEDENHKPVRRLSVWYRKPRWLPDLREFSSTLREVPFDITSITSATRSSGQYSLIWDGKDDAGEWVPQGNYTIFIEAAREHGTYQLIKQAIKCDDKTKQISMQGNEEIAGSSLVLKAK